MGFDVGSFVGPDIGPSQVLLQVLINDLWYVLS